MKIPVTTEGMRWRQWNSSCFVADNKRDSWVSFCRCVCFSRLTVRSFAVHSLQTLVRANEQMTGCSGDPHDLHQRWSCRNEGIRMIICSSGKWGKSRSSISGSRIYDRLCVTSAWHSLHCCFPAASVVVVEVAAVRHQQRVSRRVSNTFLLCFSFPQCICCQVAKYWHFSSSFVMQADTFWFRWLFFTSRFQVSISETETLFPDLRFTHELPHWVGNSNGLSARLSFTSLLWQIGFACQIRILPDTLMCHWISGQVFTRGSIFYSFNPVM